MFLLGHFCLFCFILDYRLINKSAIIDYMINNVVVKTTNLPN